MRTGFRFVIAFSLMLSSATGQSVVADQKPLPTKPPNSAAQPRRKLALDPDTLYARLVSKDDRLRREAFAGLGDNLLVERELTDVRLFAVNLDADSDLERVLIFRSSSLDGAAVIAKQENGVWWELGAFYCCGLGGSPSVEPFIELRETVWSGTKDIIVRLGGPQGTGVGERGLSIYRVLHGRLYRVFQIVENAYNLTEEESSRITYPDVLSSSDSQILVVHRTKQVGKRRTSQCIPYRWDARRFAFVQTPPNGSVCRERN